MRRRTALGAVGKRSAASTGERSAPWRQGPLSEPWRNGPLSEPWKKGAKAREAGGALSAP
eukprot:2170461-Pleurochrysis_carterae.AAC.1